MTIPGLPAGALDGVRVIDLTHALAGPFCTMLLADLGADVLKVEPLHGDGTRRLGPFAPDDELKLFGGYFHSVNRNKRSLSLDMHHKRGAEVLIRLLEGVDVVVENYREGVMDRFGVSYDVLHERFPKLVYACIRGFGDSHTGNLELPVSPYAHWPAFDVVAQAMGGITGVTGPGPERPMNAGAPVGDLVPAMFAALGIVAAVRHAERTGQGQMVDVSMYDGVLALCERIVYLNSFAGDIAKPQGGGNPQLLPFDSFPAKDGWFSIAAPGERHWRLLCDLMGRPELGTDPRYSTNVERLTRAAEVREIIGSWTVTQTKAELADLMGGLVPSGPVQTSADIFADPHAARREMLVEVEHPGVLRPLTIVGSPIKMTETPTGVRVRAPLLGEHTNDALTSAGYTAAEIAALNESGAIGWPGNMPTGDPNARTTF